MNLPHNGDRNPDPAERREQPEPAKWVALQPEQFSLYFSEGLLGSEEPRRPQPGDHFVLNLVRPGFAKLEGDYTHLKVERVEGATVFAQYMNALAVSGIDKQSCMFELSDLQAHAKKGEISGVWLPEINGVSAGVKMFIEASVDEPDLPDSNTKTERDPLRALPHLEVLKNEDLLDYGGYHSRNQGPKSLEGLVASLSVNVDLAARTHLQRGPQPGDLFTMMGETFLLADVNYGNGAVNFRKLNGTGNNGYRESEGLELIEREVKSGRIKSVQLNQAESLDDIEAWLESVPEGFFKHSSLKARDVVPYLKERGLEGLDPAGLSLQTLQAHFNELQPYVPVAPVLLKVLGSKLKQINRALGGNIAGQRYELKLSDPPETRQYTTTEEESLVVDLMDGVAVIPNAVRAQDLFEQALRMESLKLI